MLSFTLLALLVPVTLAAPASKKPDLSCESTSKRLIVFGDSLSDNGSRLWRRRTLLLAAEDHVWSSWHMGPKQWHPPCIPCKLSFAMLDCKYALLCYNTLT